MIVATIAAELFTELNHFPGTFIRNPFWIPIGLQAMGGKKGAECISLSALLLLC